jgi:hypothetical protein
MAVTVTPIFIGQYVKHWGITATADADTTATITHEFSEEPFMIALYPTQQAPAALSGWAVTGTSATAITLTKGVGVGSGAAGVQVRLTAFARGANVLK